MHLWSRLFVELRSPVIIRGRVHPRILCIYHGLLAVSFLPARCPLCIPELRGMELHSYSSFACCTELSIINRPPTRPTDVVERQQHFRSRHGRPTVRPDLFHRQPTALVWTFIVNLRPALQLQIKDGGVLSLKTPNGHDIEHCIASTLRVIITAAQHDLVRRAPFLQVPFTLASSTAADRLP